MAVAARRKREKQARRESILDAAEAIVMKRGAHVVKMNEIAHAAEVSKGTLYLYFPSKDALLAGLAERNINALVPEVRAFAESPTSTGLEKVLAIVGCYLEHLGTNEGIYRLMVEWLNQPEVDDSSEAFQAYRDRVRDLMEPLVASLAAGIGDGSIRPDIDPIHQAMHVWGSGIGVLLLHHNAKGMGKRIAIPVDFGRLLPMHVDAVRRLLEVRQ